MNISIGAIKAFVPIKNYSWYSRKLFLEIKKKKNNNMELIQTSVENKWAFDINQYRAT